MITYCPRCGAQFREVIRGEWFESGVRCDDCGLAVADPPLMLARTNDDDEVQYDLSQWQSGERGSATTALLEAEIPYRWEADLVLVVPAVAEDEVDLLLDELGETEELTDDGEADGGEVAQAAMSDLFVAADRLQHDPADVILAAEVIEATNTIGDSLPPYGIERPVWRRIQALAATLAADLEEAAEEETVAADARGVREYLRDLV
jgi:hypothetical protein